MSSIVRQQVGKHVYLYESSSYRDKQGRPRNKRVIIGKVDPTTKSPVYKPTYLARMAGKKDALDTTMPIFSVQEVQHSSVKDYGAFYLLDSIAEKIGLYQALQSAFPQCWRELFTLACYLVCCGDAFLYCEDWIERTQCLDIGNLSSQRISELLAAITTEDREAFHRHWCQRRCEEEYLALDITSISSYSALIDEVEWGYNRDQEKLAQINLCLLVGDQSRLPVYQSVYSGSLKDVSTLKTTLSKMEAVSEGKPTLVVMDKGFYSARNIDAMLGEAASFRFIIAVPFTSDFARQAVEEARVEIDRLKNTFIIGSESIRGITRPYRWNDKKVFVHVYYNAIKAARLREDLYAQVILLKEEADAAPAKAAQQERYKKYLRIRASKKNCSGYAVTVREDAVKASLRHAGWMVAISNTSMDAKEALSIYRGKDVVEKGFNQLKNTLDMGRLRVHQESAMNSKLFLGFLSLILTSHIHKTMTEKGLYRKMTLKKMLHTLTKLRTQDIKGNKIHYPMTKEQKLCYKAFGVKMPV